LIHQKEKKKKSKESKESNQKEDFFFCGILLVIFPNIIFITKE